MFKFCISMITSRANQALRITYQIKILRLDSFVRTDVFTDSLAEVVRITAERIFDSDAPERSHHHLPQPTVFRSLAKCLWEIESTSKIASNSEKDCQ
jgi:hypothetical protein